ncbi:MAG: tetratricopeptide repeat protein, partial [Elainellaceae cyanobacterium]
MRLNPFTRRDRQRALADRRLGVTTELAAYDDALQRLENPMSAEAAEIWRQRGAVLRRMKQPEQARHSFEQALVIEPGHGDTLSDLGTVLAMLGRYDVALDYCNRGLALMTGVSSAHGFNARGLVYLMSKQLTQALQDFDQAIAIDPAYDKVWHNRGIALTRLGQEKAALESVERALALDAQSVAAQALAAYLLVKQGQFQQALAHCEQIQAVQPRSYPAALYGLASIVASGQLWAYVSEPTRRRQLGRSLDVVAMHIRFRLLAIAGLIALLLTPAGWAAPLQAWIAKLFSVGIIALMVVDLWRHRHRWQMIWAVYFRCGILTYIRAAGIIIATVGAFLLADRIFPPFMRWGWADLVFDQPGNIIFQPFNLFSGGAPLTATSTIAEHLAGQIFAPVAWIFWGVGAAAIAPIAAQLPGPALGTTLANPTPSPWAALFVLGFWLLLVVGIPFWARLEEHIFRRGANTWNTIIVRSTQFGLVHLIAGIPLLGGVVLILPGFLFACRYKYVYERHMKQHGDVERAQEAGVTASTADHAVYNAILVSIVAGSLLAAA